MSKIIISILILLLSQNVFSNLNEFSFHFQHITINEGLPQNTVNSIIKDSYGFMWFATENGLCKFDGYDIRIYKEINGVKVSSKGFYNTNEVEITIYRSYESLKAEGYNVPSSGWGED